MVLPDQSSSIHTGAVTAIEACVSIKLTAGLHHTGSVQRALLTATAKFIRVAARSGRNGRTVAKTFNSRLTGMQEFRLDFKAHGAAPRPGLTVRGQPQAEPGDSKCQLVSQPVLLASASSSTSQWGSFQERVRGPGMEPGPAGNSELRNRESWHRSPGTQEWPPGPGGPGRN
eukprot:765292-Hanusia_phi.AAC.4